MLNSADIKVQPWGTPVFILSHSLKVLCVLSFCFLFVKQLFIYLKAAFALNPYAPYLRTMNLGFQGWPDKGTLGTHAPPIIFRIKCALLTHGIFHPFFIAISSSHGLFFILHVCFITCPSGITAVITRTIVRPIILERANSLIFEDAGAKPQKNVIFCTLLLTFSKTGEAKVTL